jgi:hypothetical protein
MNKNPDPNKDENEIIPQLIKPSEIIVEKDNSDINDKSQVSLPISAGMPYTFKKRSRSFTHRN